MNRTGSLLSALYQAEQSTLNTLNRVGSHICGHVMPWLSRDDFPPGSGARPGGPHLSGLRRSGASLKKDTSLRKTLDDTA